MDKGVVPISVDDLLRLVDGLKAKGVNSFKWGDIEFSGGPARVQSKRKIVPPAPEPKNAVDLALDLNGRSTDSDEDGAE